MASDPKWVESGKLSWQRMEDIRAAAKKPPYAPWATVSGCATAWDTQFSGEGLSGARTFYFLHTLLQQTFQELLLSLLPEVLIRFHDYQVRPVPGVTTHRKCKTSLLLFSTGNVLHVEEKFLTFLLKSCNFWTKWVFDHQFLHVFRQEAPAWRRRRNWRRVWGGTEQRGWGFRIHWSTYCFDANLNFWCKHVFQAVMAPIFTFRERIFNEFDQKGQSPRQEEAPVHAWNCHRVRFWRFVPYK